MNINKKCRKTIHKKYRKLGDIWGRLALKKRDNFITSLVYEYANQALYKRVKTQPKKLKKITKKKFRSKKKKRVFFYFQTNTHMKRRRKKRLSARGGLLRARRQISLFYGGGRIRKKTFRRYGKMITERSNSNKKRLFAYQKPNADTYTALIESRLDVLLLRANFVNSIYSARIYVINHKSWVQTKGNSIRYPGYLIDVFQPFGLIGSYTRKLRKNLFTRVRKKTILCLPSYLYINFPLLLAFKTENPRTPTLSYPFSETIGAVAIFRKSFQLL